MKSRLLEIGPRDEPAFYTPGTVFAEEEIDYFSASLDSVPDREPDEHRRYAKDHQYQPIPLGVLATMEALPFKDASFRHVIMKSVLGESWCAQASGNLGPDDPSFLNGRSLNEALYGITEAHRVLTPGGTLAIAEENTPTPSKLIITKLQEAGFIDITLIPYSTARFTDSYDYFVSMSTREGRRQPDPAWEAARGNYWGKSQPPIADRPPEAWQLYCDAWSYSSASYIVVATKNEPTQPEQQAAV